MTKRIHGAGGGGGGGNQTNYVTQNVTVENPVVRPTYTPDSPGLRSTTFAQLQFLVCEGEVAGPAEGNTIEGLERSVYLDDTPVRVGDRVSPQPSDLAISFGRPAGQQTGVPGFTRVSTVIGVDTEVRRDLPVAQNVTVADNASTWYGRVILTFEALLDQRQTENDPGVYGYTVSLLIEVTDNLGVDTTVFDGTVGGKFSGPFQREFEFEFTGQGPWTVRVTRRTADDRDLNSGERTFRSTFNFSTVVVSLDQRLIYPQSSVLSIGLRADQYSALPNVSIDMRGLIVDIPSNYDPETRTYTGLWDGTFVRGFTDNPAWILRDLILNERYGLGRYVEADQVDRWTLMEIAQYCDEAVPAPGGGTEPRFTCNLILQTSEQAWLVLQQLSSIFRGLLYYSSGTIVPVQDRPRTAVFTFNETNTIEEFDDSGKVSQGNFIYSGTAQRARHTAVLASWDDPNDNYQPRVEYFADEEGIERFGYRAMDMRLIGVTSRGQALRAANWALLSESLLTDTVTFRTNEIGLAIRPGDIVKIADPTKAARRYGGRIQAVNPAGTIVTLDDRPPEPAAGWGGSTFSYMQVDADGDPVLIDRQISALNGNTLTLVANTTVAAPTAQNPWLIETPDRTAQLFRIITVEEQDDGIYSIAALRYREDIFNTVDNGTPLNENEDFLFTPVNPEPPEITVAQVIWDNNQAKLDFAWQPPDTNNVLFGFDTTVRAYRLQWQAGSENADGTIFWDDVWREVPTQYDNREQVPIDQLVVTDRFRARMLSISRLGVESEWTDIVELDPITTWFPLPDLEGDTSAGVPIGGLSHLNQSTGTQLFTWRVNAPIPPYVNGIRLWGRPADRPLTDVEAAGLNDPDADGWYQITDEKLGDYYSIAFHSLQGWEARFNLLTAIPGLVGDTFGFDTVDVAELRPPTPTNFRMVYEGGSQSRVGQKRFSWTMPDPPPFPDRWPLGRVTDLAVFNVRYRQGTTPNWDRSMALFSDGIPGDQTWFETNLFDYGRWCVMIKAVDRTGWESDEFASITIGIGDPLPTNVVERIDLRDGDFPGDLVNFRRGSSESGLMYPEPLTDAMYQLPLDDEMYEGDTGFVLQQIDASAPSYYTTLFNVTHDQAQLVIYTQANATYRWFLRRNGTDDDRMYQDPLTDPMYEGVSDGAIITQRADFIITENNDFIEAVFGSGADGLMYEGTGGDTNAEGWHPYAPNEVVTTGIYEARLEMISLDGTTAGIVSDIDFVLDYPDVFWQAEDVDVPVTGARVTFPPATFRHLKAVNLTVQDNSFAAGAATNAVVEFKSNTLIDIRTIDASGQPVAGVVDVFTVGY